MRRGDETNTHVTVRRKSYDSRREHKLMISVICEKSTIIFFVAKYLTLTKLNNWPVVVGATFYVPCTRLLNEWTNIVLKNVLCVI